MLWYADDTGFYFETLSPKEISSQIHVNAAVEVCFYNYPDDVLDAKELRISGEIEFVTDTSIIDEAMRNRQYFEDLAGQPIYLEVFKLSHGDAHFWNLKTDVLRERQLEHLAF
jgi:uncharacterized pyridoxamine 5'-phosphate oxidase family protein